MKKLFALIMVAMLAFTASANTYHKLTSEPQDWSGQYIIVYADGTTARIFNGQDVVDGNVAGTITGDSIVGNFDNYLVKVDPMTGGYSLQFMATGMYLSGTDDKNILNFTPTAQLNTLSIESGAVLATSNNSVLRFNSTSNQMRFRYYKASSWGNQKAVTFYKADNAVTPIDVTYDTISVTEARTRIDGGNLAACYVKGIVVTEPSDPGTYGNTICWLADIDNPTDSLQGYKIAGQDGAVIPTIQDIPFGLGDTVLFFANELKKFNAIYEINGGYLAEILGGIQYQLIDLTDGDAEALRLNSPDRNWSIEVKNNAGFLMYFLIHNNKEHGIAGSYTLDSLSNFALTADADFVRLESGSLSIDYLTTIQGYNQYTVSAKWMASSQAYRFVQAFEIPAYDENDNPYSLADDKPYIPAEGDTITCAQAKEYVGNYVASGAESEFEVYVMGYATELLANLSNDQQQSFWMDDAKGTKKTIEAFYCYLPTGKTVLKDTKVLIHGKLSSYNGTPEIKNGDIIILEGGGDDIDTRDLTYEDVPEEAISVADAVAIGEALGDNETSEEVITVVGYIAKVAYQTANDTASWYMSDTREDGSGHYSFEAYKCYISNEIRVGDYVFVTGQVTKYVGTSGNATIEIKYGTAAFAHAPQSGLDAAAIIETSVKVLRDGQLYILRDGHLYNIQGAEVK